MFQLIGQIIHLGIISLYIVELTVSYGSHMSLYNLPFCSLQKDLMLFLRCSVPLRSSIDDSVIAVVIFLDDYYSGESKMSHS